MPLNWRSSLRAPCRSLHSTQPARASPTRKVVPGDLSATLENHRTANRASIIRKHGVEDDEPSLTPEKKVVVAKQGKAPVIFRSHLRHLQKQGGFREVAPKPTSHQTSLAEDRYYPSQRGASFTRVMRPQPVELPSKNTGSAAPPKKNRNSHLDRMGEAEREYSQTLQKNAQELGALGVYIKPLNVEASEPQKPYLALGLKGRRDPSEVLEVNIRKFLSWITLNQNELHIRKVLTTKLLRKLKWNHPDFRFRAFGSTSTKLATLTSDIDIGVHISTLPPFEPRKSHSRELRGKVIKRLHVLLARLKTMNEVEEPVLISWATFPLIRMKLKSLAVELQIVAHNPDQSYHKYTLRTIKEFPVVKPIYQFIKTALDARGLADAREGGLSSYTVFVMVVTFLRLSPHPSRTDRLSPILIDCLQFWANFDTFTRCMSSEPPREHDRSDPKRTQSLELKRALEIDPLLAARVKLCADQEAAPFKLILQDPMDPTNDLGKAATRIMDIRATFGVLAQNLRDYLRQDEVNSIDALHMFFGNTLSPTRGVRDRHERQIEAVGSLSELMDAQTKSETSKSISNVSNIAEDEVDGLDDEV
ncbi:MAG: hypothetical protein M1831_005338 [Alyxoria varia]|nr:MAG: hypothetical protein M1831_005338 [Alyxoria varia]